MLLDKKVGLLCHPDGNEYVDTLISRVKRYLYEKGEWSPENSSTFSLPLPTGQTEIRAELLLRQNAETLRILNEKIKTREIEKYYLTVVHGKMAKESDTLTAFLTKDNKKNKVSISNKETENSKKLLQNIPFWIIRMINPFLKLI